MQIKRTYPQPDSPAENLGARERAMAVFKYLLNLEPEQAVVHPLFPCIVHSYKQAIQAPALRSPSVVPMIRTIDGTQIEPLQAEKL